MEKNITPINQLSWKDRLKSYKKHPGSFILLLLVGASAVITVTVLVYLVGYILIHGVPYLRPSLFSLTYNSDNVSMMPAIINTITMVLLALLFLFRLESERQFILSNMQKKEINSLSWCVLQQRH